MMRVTRATEARRRHRLGERSVRTYLKELEAGKFLEVTQRGLGKTNVYRLHVQVPKRE